MKKLNINLILYLFMILTMISCECEKDQDIIPPDNDPSPTELTATFKNALITDKQRDNLHANSKITITNVTGNTIITDYPYLKDLLVTDQNLSTNSWCIVKGLEASTIRKITKVNVSTGEITYEGTASFSVGDNVEFINPFVNYEMIPNRSQHGLFTNYPTTFSNSSYNYIQPGGIFESTPNNYTMLCPVVIGSHTSRSVYVAKSTDLINWSIDNTIKFMDAEKTLLSDAKPNGNVFTTNNPYILSNGNLLWLLAVESSTNNTYYMSCFFITDVNLNIVKNVTKIKMLNENNDDNVIPLSVAFFRDKFRLLVNRREINNVTSLVEYTYLNKSSKTNEDAFIDLLENGYNSTSEQGPMSIGLIQKSSDFDNFLSGKIDDATYIEYKGDLHILFGCEPKRTGNVAVTNNREYGFLYLSSFNYISWMYHNKTPTLVNPIQMNNIFSELSWCWDHLGGFMSYVIKDDYMYIYLAQGSDNPDYFISGIKHKL